MQGQAKSRHVMGFQTENLTSLGHGDSMTIWQLSRFSPNISQEQDNPIEETRYGFSLPYARVTFQ